MKGQAKAGSRGVREAQRRLAAILRTARKLSLTPDDLAKLPGARKLAAAGAAAEAEGPAEAAAAAASAGDEAETLAAASRHVLPLAASGAAVLIAIVLLLVACVGDGPPLARLRNSSDTGASNTAAGLALAKEQAARAAAVAVAAAAAAEAADTGPPHQRDREIRSEFGKSDHWSEGGGDLVGSRNSDDGGGGGGGGDGEGPAGSGRERGRREEVGADGLFDAPIRLMRR